MKTVAQRAELQKRIWQIANDVRGSIDGWDFKQYVLGTLFYRFISEHFAQYMEGGENFRYADINDDAITDEIKDEAVKTKGYFIYLSPKGKAVIVKFPGIFYRGGAEKKIREYLVENNYIETVISLDSNLFFGTSIAVNILVLSKNKTTTNIQFIDANKLYKQQTNTNILTDEHIEKILKVFKSKEEIKHFSKNAILEEIRENDYNLSVNSYVEIEDTREKIDIKRLNEEIKERVKNIDKLRGEIDKIVAEIESE